MPGTYEQTIKIFNDKKDEIYSLYENFALLDDSKKKYVIKYYDDFYDIINDPKQVERRFYKNCELNHSHLYNIK